MDINHLQFEGVRAAFVKLPSWLSPCSANFYDSHESPYMMTVISRLLGRNRHESYLQAHHRSRSVSMESVVRLCGELRARCRSRPHPSSPNSPRPHPTRGQGNDRVPLRATRLLLSIVRRCHSGNARHCGRVGQDWPKLCRLQRAYRPDTHPHGRSPGGWDTAELPVRLPQYRQGG